MNSIQNNISDLLKLARKFNCFYLSGKLINNFIVTFASPRNIVSLMRFFDVYTGICQGTCKPFFVAGNQVGLIRPDVMKHLQRFPEVCSTDVHSLYHYKNC